MKIRAVFLLCITLLFALTPLMLTGFDGYDPEDFPVQIARPAIQPAGYAFSIWLVIYLGLILHAGLGLLSHHSNPVWDRPRLALMAAMLAGTTWVAFAEDFPVVATGVILAMAGAAILAAVQTAGARSGPDLAARWLYQPPVALLAGWVTAAAGVGSGVTLSGLGWLSDQTAAFAMLAVILLTALAVQSRLGRVPAYGLAVIWALVGIVVANWSANAAVAFTALAGMAAMALMLWRLQRSA